MHQRHERSLKLHAELCEYMYQSGDTPRARLRGLVSGQPNLAGLLAGVSVAAVVFAGEVMLACADGHAARAPAEGLGLCAVLDALDKGERYVNMYTCEYM